MTFIFRHLKKSLQGNKYVNIEVNTAVLSFFETQNKTFNKTETTDTKTKLADVSRVSGEITLKNNKIIDMSRVPI